jgi:hypothetical protein
LRRPFAGFAGLATVVLAITDNCDPLYIDFAYTLTGQRFADSEILRDSAYLPAGPHQNCSRWERPERGRVKEGAELAL